MVSISNFLQCMNMTMSNYVHLSVCCLTVCLFVDRRLFVNVRKSQNSFSNAKTLFSNARTPFSNAKTPFSNDRTPLSNAITPFSNARTTFSKARNSVFGLIYENCRSMDHLHYRLKFHHNFKKHHKISNIPKFRCEML